MNQQQNNYYYMPSYLLTIAFVVLKLCKVIIWSWIWILSPIWISFLFAFIVLTPLYYYLKKLDRENKKELCKAIEKYNNQLKNNPRHKWQEKLEELEKRSKQN